MVVDPGGYHWSSYGIHGHGFHASMWSAHPTYLSLGETKVQRQKHYRRLVGEALEQDVLAKIRHCANSGLVLGTEKYREQVAKLVQ